MLGILFCFPNLYLAKDPTCWSSAEAPYSHCGFALVLAHPAGGTSMLLAQPTDLHVRNCGTEM